MEMITRRFEIRKRATRRYKINPATPATTATAPVPRKPFARTAAGPARSAKGGAEGQGRHATPHAPVRRHTPAHHLTGPRVAPQPGAAAPGPTRMAGRAAAPRSRQAHARTE